MREILDTAAFVTFVVVIFIVLGNIGELQDPLVSISH